MRVPEGSGLGQLVTDNKSSVIDIIKGKPFSLGLLKGVAEVQNGQPFLLFKMPYGSDLIVAKAGKQQAGAFLIKAEEGFSVKTKLDQKHYKFKALKIIEVEIEKGSLCAFCRTPLQHSSLYRHSPEHAEVLCGMCTEAEVWNPE